MGDPSVVCSSMGGTAGQGGSCVLSPPDEKAALKDWEYILNFRPHEAAARLLVRFSDMLLPGPGYHPIEDGLGPLNLDFYPVQILKLPSIAGTELDAATVLKHVRRNLTDFLDRAIAWVDAYSVEPGEDDAARWLSENPLKTVMHFHLAVMVAGGLGGEDTAGVVCAEHASDHWIFSTIKTPKDGNHPVSGNRQFGVATLGAGKSLSSVYQKSGISIDNADKDALFFFTRGADRVTNVVHQIGSDTVFAGGHACWQSLQQKVMSWINANGGTATIPGFVSQRWDWSKIKAGGLTGLWSDPPR
jgi:hypothetical protein